MQNLIKQSCKLIIRSIICLILGGGYVFCQSPNLIIDPSFEDTLSPVGYLTYQALHHWGSLDAMNPYSARSIYFSLTNPDLVARLPSNQWFYQLPRTGGGGLLENLFYSLVVDEYRRSILKTKLKTKLIQGKMYYAKLHYVPGERYYSWFADGISMYFDNGQLDTMISVHHNTTGIYPHVVPQIINPYGNVVTDTVNWSVLEGCFMANGTEEYLTIGNFKSDTLTAKINNPVGNQDDPGSSMFLDDVSVYALDIANWVPDAHGTLNDSVLIGLPNYQIPDAKWYTYNMSYLGSGSQIKVLATQAQQQYICAIEMCNTTVYDTFNVFAWPTSIGAVPQVSELFNVLPTANGFYIKANGATNNSINVRVLDIHGKLLLTQQCALGSTDCYISANFASGIYLVQIIGDKDAKPYQTKLQINN
jgi:hypothetical protein